MRKINKNLRKYTVACFHDSTPFCVFFLLQIRQYYDTCKIVFTVCSHMCFSVKFVIFISAFLRITVKFRINSLGKSWPVTFFSGWKASSTVTLLWARQEIKLSFGVIWQWLIQILFEWEIKLPFEVKESRHSISFLSTTLQFRKYFSMYPYLKWPGIPILSLCRLRFWIKQSAKTNRSFNRD